jgi:hypothetical protein
MEPRQHSRRTRVKRLPGAPTTRRKPLKERLSAHGVRYEQVARLAERSYRAVQKHIDGDFFSPAIAEAIDRLAPKGSAA